MNSITLRQTIRKWPGVQRIIELNVALEDWWFDFYHQVDTSVLLDEQVALGWPEDKLNFHYLPIRPKCARRALRNLHLDDPGEYTFIDFGSGKGRVLFVASDFPFARIVGIEYAPELHQAACRNIQSYRSDTRKCGRIEAICQDMTTFHFPEGPLALFFYNPASESVMRTIAAKITALSQACWVVYANPQCNVFGSLNTVRKTEKYAIYTNATELIDPS